MNKKFDVVGSIMDYEQGDLNNKDTLVLFAHLIKSGQAWGLQGHYGRMSRNLIDNGYINSKGKILKEA